MFLSSNLLRDKIIKFGHLAGFTCVYWNDRQGQLKLSNSRLRRGWVAVQLLLVLVYEIYVFYRSFIEHSGSRFADKKTFRVRYIFMLWSFLNCNHIGNVLTAEYVRVMNGLDELKQKLQGK